MQVPPSSALFQALGTLMSPQGAQSQGADKTAFARQAAEAMRPGGTAAPGATVSGAGGGQQTLEAKAVTAAAKAEPPPPGTPVSRGMIIDLKV
jgi:hypothetical protein